MHASANSDQRMKRWIAKGIPTTVIVSRRTMLSSVSIPRVNGRSRRSTRQVCLTGEYAAPGIDLVQDDGDRRGRDHRREQAADPSDQDGHEGGYRTVPAVQRHQGRDAGEVKDHPLDRGSDETDRNEDRARRDKGRQVLRVDAWSLGRSDRPAAAFGADADLVAATSSSPPGAEKPSEDEEEKRDERHGMDQRPVQDRSRRGSRRRRRSRPRSRRASSHSVTRGSCSAVRPPTRSARPLRFERRTRRAVVDAALLLAPASVEGEPGERRPTETKERPAAAPSGVAAASWPGGCHRNRSPRVRPGRGRARCRNSWRASPWRRRSPGACPASGASCRSTRPLAAGVLGEVDLVRSPRSASAALDASKSTWAISQSLSCLSVKSLKV